MRSINRILLILLASALLASPPAFAETDLNLTGEYAILIDQDTGQVLYEKNADTRWYPASTTKILTALIILENHTLDEVVTIDGESPFVEGSKIFIFEGEQLTVEQLLNAMLIASANDCAEALARFHSSTLEDFAMQMNKRAFELGATESHFINPHGLHDEDHYTTARDLALISKAAYDLPAFQEIVSKTTYSIPPNDYQPETRYMKTTNHFINSDKRMLYKGTYVPETYEIVDGIKTGYTTASHHNLVSTAQKDGDRLVSVVLDSDAQNIYVDSRTLIDYGFDTFRYHNFTFAGSKITEIAIEDGNVSSLALFARDSVSGMVQKDLPADEIEEIMTLDEVQLPIEADQTLGTLAFVVGGETIGSTPLISDQAVVVQTFSMTLKDHLIRRDGLGHLDTRYYVDILVNLLLSLLIWRSVITLFRIARRRRKRRWN